MVTVEIYDKEMAAEWNGFVARSKNGTFLFDRNFMDYHAERFSDASLVFRGKRGRLCGLLPANFHKALKTVFSHGGLTYGGLVLDYRAVQISVNEMIALAADFYSCTLGAQSLVYKPTPYIYHSIPAEEDLYALYRMGASLTSRAVSSALVPSAGLRFRKDRRAGVARALSAGLSVEEVADCSSPLLLRFHNILTESLMKRHNVTPVHSFDEMKLLTGRFPENIRLFVVKNGDDVVSGGWVFVTSCAVHTQYLVNTDEGRRMGAEDLLLDYLISEKYASARYFDFGISTENNGMYLNENLISMKEGFGARSVCYDTYTLALPRHSAV